MIYVPTHKTMDESWALSADLWAQVAPNAGGTTQYLVAPQEHPVTGEVYFYMDEAQAEQFGLDVANAITEWPQMEEGLM